jgi:N-succinyl-L-ornithine transcarbamylase
MRNFLSADDVVDVPGLVTEAINIKSDPFVFDQLGLHKTLGLVFFNPSLRTRMSTQKAAMNLGLNSMVMNAAQDGWAIETREGVVMHGDKPEHIKEA